MFTPPADLDIEDMQAAVGRNWGLEMSAVTYAPVGFGSHHWSCSHGDERWFATVDDLRMGERSSDTLSAALTTAAELRLGGLAFVIAPLPTFAGDHVVDLSPHYRLALYPHVDGITSTFGPYPTRHDRHAVIEHLVALHDYAGRARTCAPVDDFAIPQRDGLQAALARIDAPWQSGPFGEPARSLLLRHRAPLLEAVARYDELAAQVGSDRERFVITHGEPHRANTITTADGVVLIDWETARLAPRERDLWSVIDEDPGAADYYRSRSGAALDTVALRLYKLWWDLCEVSLFSADLQALHTNTAETRLAWEGLQQHLDPTRWADLGT